MNTFSPFSVGLSRDDPAHEAEAADESPRVTRYVKDGLRVYGIQA
jgi:hypothetical protein